MTPNTFTMIKYLIIILAAVGILFSCIPDQKKKQAQSMKKSPFSVAKNHFGITTAGDSVTQFTFSNSNGLEVKILNYGGLVTHLKVPDKNGKIEDVVLGYDNLEGYLKSTPYFGAIVGRYGNRIAKGKFTLDGVEYSLVTNNGENALHGGTIGFDKVMWDAEPFEDETGAGLKLTYLSKDMEEGFPGNLNVTVTYTIKESNEISIDYHATTDKKTVINLTQHSYFNLTGNTKRDILDHEVMIKSANMIPVDGGLIPTGEMIPVAGTPFDFTEATRVGDRIDADHEQIALGGGYDHCWVLDKPSPDALEWVAKAVDNTSGRVLELATTEPGVQFYTGNFLDGTITGKHGVVYNKRFGLCFEPEHYPDSPNQANFPSVELSPGEEYHTTTVWRFSTIK